MNGLLSGGMSERDLLNSNSPSQLVAPLTVSGMAFRQILSSFQTVFDRAWLSHVVGLSST